jgi:hypothetical protein
VIQISDQQIPKKFPTFWSKQRFEDGPGLEVSLL